MLYLPGYSRQDMRALETCPVELQPLAELQYRGVLWSQRNGRDWTVNAFLQSRDGGLGIKGRGRPGNQRGAPAFSSEASGGACGGYPSGPLPLRAFYLDGLIHPDNVKDVLRWLNDPNGYQDECSDHEWAALVALCESHYDFHP